MIAKFEIGPQVGLGLTACRSSEISQRRISELRRNATNQLLLFIRLVSLTLYNLRFGAFFTVIC